MAKHRDQRVVEAGATPLGDDGRAALREAIAVALEAERLHRGSAEAHQRAETAVVESYGPESEAERALEKAKADAPARLAAEFRGVAPEPGLTVEQAEAAVAAIRRKRDDIRVARDALEAETKLAANRATWKRDSVKGAIGRVVKVSPAAHALLDAYVAAERRYTALRLAVDTLGREGALPDRAVGHRPGEPDRTLSHQWSEALQALSADADAELPEVP